MSNGGDAAEQVVRMSLDGVEYVIKIAGAGAKNLAALLLAALKTKRHQPATLKISGQERLKRMLKSGQPLDVFPVREKDIKGFMTEAKKYGIVYCAIRDKEPKADGMVDVLVRKEDSPKINRVMERLQYGAVDTATIQSEIAKTRAEQNAEPAAPEKMGKQEIESFLDDIMVDDGKSKEGQNQAVQPPVQQKEVPEKQQDFFPDARTSGNPSELGSDSSSKPEKRVTDGRPSVREDLRQIRADLKKEKEAEQQREEPRPSRGGQQTTRHQQPQNTRKQKSKTGKER